MGKGGGWAGACNEFACEFRGLGIRPLDFRDRRQGDAARSAAAGYLRQLVDGVLLLCRVDHLCEGFNVLLVKGSGL